MKLGLLNSSLKKAIPALAVLSVLLIGVSLALRTDSEDIEDARCKGIDIDIESVCLNNHLVQLNNNQPTVDIVVNNMGGQLNGLVVGLGDRQTKLFRTVKESETQVLQIPSVGTGFKTITLQPMIVEDRQVIYCAAQTEKLDGVASCA